MAIDDNATQHEDKCQHSHSQREKMNCIHKRKWYEQTIPKPMESAVNTKRMKTALKRPIITCINMETRTEHSLLKFAQCIMKHHPESLFQWDCERKTERGKEFYTQLHYFCECGFPNVVQYIWNQLEEFLHKTPNDVIRNMSDRLLTNFYLTPLHLACKLGAPLSVVKLLVQKNPESLSRKDGFGPGDRHTPLHYACVYSSFEIIKYIIDQHPLSLYLTASKREYGRNGFSLLHHACYHRASTTIIKAIVSKAPTLVRQESTGPCHCLPLHIACEKGSSLDVIKLLVEQYPEALSKTEGTYFLTPLGLLCKHGASWEVMKFIVEAWPSAILEAGKLGIISQQREKNCVGRQLLQLLYDTICKSFASTKNMDENYSKAIAELKRRGWIEGIVIAIRYKPQILHKIDIDTNNHSLMSEVLAKLGRPNAQLMWELVKTMPPQMFGSTYMSKMQ